MATDVIISAFAVPPQDKARAVAMPTELFKSKPKIIGLGGIGSDAFMGPGDTARKPREPWGGKPFSREAAMYRAKSGGDDSVLMGLLKSQARGIEVGRVALVGFSAGGTFVGSVLKNPKDAALVDVVILLDALHVAKNWNGTFVEQSLEPWANYGARCLLAGVRAARGTGSRDPFLGPVFVSTHTNIKQSAELEKQVGNTTASSDAVFNASVEALYKLPEYQQTGGAIKHITTNWQNLVSSFPPGAFPVTIGPSADKEGNQPWAKVAAPTKTWKSMPMPAIRQAFGNFYDLDYGGTVAADHVFQAWHVQRAAWQTFLIPRWNADVSSPYAVSGLGMFERCCPGPGGNILGIQTGAPYWALAAALAGGFWLGKTIVE